MPTVNLYAAGSAIIDSANTSSNDHVSKSTTVGKKQTLAVNFEEMQQYRFNKLQAVTLYLYALDLNGGTEVIFRPRRYLSEFNQNSITYATKPESAAFASMVARSSGVPGYFSVRAHVSWTQYVPMDLVKYGFEVETNGCSLQTAYGSNRPYVAVELLTTLVGLQLSDLTPANGSFVQKSKPSLFSWNATVPEGDQCCGDVAVSSTVFRWKDSNGVVHTINSGSALSLEVPANTFSGNSIQWQVEITANSGIVTTSDWVTVSTAEPTSSAVATSPNNTAVDGSSENVFTWEHVIATGTDQTAYEIQTSPDNVTWKTLSSGSTKSTSVVIPSNTLSGGDLYWRVRTYNSDGAAGAWSDAAHVIVISAPDAPALTVASNAPRFTVRWQQSGQQAYELQVDGVTVAKRFGEESNYTHTGYLSSGSHTVRVRIQNKYGLWSDWGTAAMQITNTEGSTIVLYADADNVVALNWVADETYSEFLIYRNGGFIGRTSAASFTDHFAIGAATYQVRGVYSDIGSYTVSNSVEVTVSVPCITISAIDEPKLQMLKLSTGSLRSTGLSASHSVTYLHHVGAALPGAEIGEAVNMTYNLDCAFKASDLDAARAFEALLGKLVCVKEPGGERYIGVLDSLSKENVGRLYRSYKARIALVDWEEGVT